MRDKIVYIILLTAFASAVFASAVYCGETVQVFKYDSGGKRDPFISLVGKEKAAAAAGLDGITAIQDIALEGIALDASGKYIAILNGEIVREGESFGILRVRKISRQSVEISLDTTNYVLELQQGETGNL